MAQKASKFSEWWGSLPVKTKHYIIWGTFLTCFLVVASAAMLAMTEPKVPREKRVKPQHNLLTGKDSKELSAEALAARVKVQDEKLKKISSGIQNLIKAQSNGEKLSAEQIAALLKNVDISDTSAVEATRNGGMDTTAESNAGIDRLELPKADGVSPDDQKLLDSLRKKVNAKKDATNADADADEPVVKGQRNKREPREPAPQQAQPPYEPAGYAPPAPPAPPKLLEIKTFGATGDAATDPLSKSGGNTPQAIRASAKKPIEQDNTPSFVLPAGSLIEGVLLTGLDAPTATHAQRQPLPALIRIKHEAVMPNRWRSDIRECFMVAGGYADLASERAFLRAESISCVRDDGTIMESTIDAYVAGEDGKNGMRGRLVSKQGQMIAQALMGGFIQGVANIYKPAQVPQLSLNPSAGASYARPGAGTALEEGLFGGMQTAGKAVADFYIDMARNTFPVIEVDAGRKVVFVVTRSAQVSGRKAQAQQKNGANNQDVAQSNNPVVNQLTPIAQGLMKINGTR